MPVLRNYLLGGIASGEQVPNDFKRSRSSPGVCIPTAFAGLLPDLLRADADSKNSLPPANPLLSRS